MSSKLNLQVYLNAYGDSVATNAPSLNNFKWFRELNSAIVNDPQAVQIDLAPGETKTVFSTARTLSQDNTTQYSIAQKPLSSSTYVLSVASGTLPNFRTPRTTGADATTQVTTTVNGPLVTFTSTGGTAFSLTGVVPGDQVFVGNLFNQLNQGTWKILSVTTTSFTVENELGVAEGPITLGSGFAAQVQIFSAAGVQVGDTLSISSGFSPATQGSYKITAVYANSLEFASIPVLPQESGILTQVAIYSSSKQLVYLETNQKISVILNGGDTAEVKPFLPSLVCPGIFLRTDTIYSMSVTNMSLNTANLFIASVG